MKAVFLIIFSCFGLTQIALASPDQQHIDKIKKQISSSIDHHLRISVETYDGRKLQGLVNEARAENFILGNEGTTTTLNYDQVKKIKSPFPRGKRFAILALVDAGLAAGLIAAKH
jgi:hypothetical protein